MCANDRTTGATAVEREIARRLTTGDVAARRYAGPFGEDIEVIRNGSPADKFYFEVKSYKKLPFPLHTTPNERHGVERAMARGAWVCFVEARGSTIRKMVWVRANEGKPVRSDRVRDFKSGPTLQERLVLKFNPGAGCYEIPAEFKGE